MQRPNHMLISQSKLDRYPARVAEAGKQTLKQPANEHAPHSFSRSPALRLMREESQTAATYCLDPETGLYFFLE